jgi:glyoxylase-like metal-dependent hydrolase (beta-lactamase superfamily II)
MTPLTRRASLALAAGFALAPRTAFTAERVTLGAADLVTLSDGHLTLPSAFFFDPAPQEALAALASELGLDLAAPLTPPCNVTLLRAGERVVLFDCGAGPTFQASAGRLGQALETEGLAPDDITDIVFTHAHPDHLWGVLDDFDEVLFRNATCHMGATELAYWSDPDTVTTIGEARASFAAGAARRIDAISDNLVPFEDGDEVLPGVMAVSTPGHTPGHMSFVVAYGSDSAMVIGDAIGNDHVAMARPEWPTGADQDMETGAATRSRLLDRLAADGMIAVGFHMGGGGIGRVERLSEGYRFVTDL